MMRVLVCGGAGYIGAHLAKLLAADGCDVTVFDNLSTGHRAAVRWGEFIEGDLRDKSALASLFGEHRFDVFNDISAIIETVWRWHVAPRY